MCAREAEPSDLDQPGRREAEQTKGGEAKLASLLVFLVLHQWHTRSILVADFRHGSQVHSA